jgi:hypothetical protein
MQTGETAREVQGSLHQASNFIKDRARSAAEQRKQTGAIKIDAIARAVHSAAQEISPEMPEAASLVHGAADHLQAASSAIRNRSVDDLVTQMNAFAKSQPAAFFGGAVLAGFALARFLKSSSEPSA